MKAITLFILAVLLIQGCKTEQADQTSINEPFINNCSGELRCLAMANKNLIIECSKKITNKTVFDYKWAGGGITPRFTLYNWVNKEQEIIIFIGDALKIQNEFGAYINYNYGCIIDAKNNKVTDTVLEKGKLPTD